MLQKFQTDKHNRGVIEYDQKAGAAPPETAETCPPDERLAVLETLLENPEFRASDRNRRFLRFVVEETVAGRADRIKAFTIAVDVFGRDASFDATVDPIVRIAAGQLRKSLRDYYAGPGQADPVQISVPLGAYVPVFEKRSSTSAFVQYASRHLTKLRSFAVGAILTVVLASSLSAFSPSWLTFASRADRGGPAVLILDNARANSINAETTQLAAMLNDALLLNVGREKAVRSVGLRPKEQLEEAVARVRTVYGERSEVFELLTSVQVEAGEARIYWHLLDSDSREVQISSLAREAFRPKAQGALVESIAAKVAASLFGYKGALARYQTDAEVASHEAVK
ncbi:hypothetical protein AB2N04_17510 [Nitratireductor sp. GISD-1A_MAKvit]|uniref:hypothetical protein n=1 Tax=Nitratireductor sp. GISD-1A_MAKvit TaxID=3234198 RepID=UPI0034670E09